MATPARPHINTEYFLQQITRAKRSTLVLDFETTLRSLASPHRFAIPLPTAGELLDCIVMSRRTRLIVSTAGDTEEVLATLAPPYPEVWGHGGRERVTPVAGYAGTGAAHFVHVRRQAGVLSTLLSSLCAAGPVAYLIGDAPMGVAANRLFVRPEFRLIGCDVSVGAEEEFVQFLIDWLRACAGEMC